MTQPRALVVFDLDGTLLRGPTVCEVLALELGRLPRMREFERLTDREDIAAARAEMAAWYADVPREQLIRSLSQVQRAPGLARGVALLQAHDIAVSIASITWHFAVTELALPLGIERSLGTGLRDSGAIDHVWPEHKAEWVRRLASELGIPRERTAAVGDTAGDYEMLKVVAAPIFVGAAFPTEPPTGQQWHHMPAADIEHIARFLIERWSL